MKLDEKLSRFPFVDPAKLRRAAIVCHRNADADAYLSAFALSGLIRRLAPDCSNVIATPGGMTTLTKKLSARFAHETVEWSDEEFDIFVAVDVGDEELLDEWKEKMRSSPAVKVLVDHHPLRDGAGYDDFVVDEEATSAAEDVFALYQVLGAPLD